MIDLELLGSQEAAEYLGFSQDAFYQRWYTTKQGIGKHPLPEPLVQLACGPIWTRDQLDEWKAEERAQ